jgi:homoserine dehydrogenase
MEEGDNFDQALKYTQEIGIAETDPSGDIDGWDASVKVAALVTVLMGVPLKPQEVERSGISVITPDAVRSALDDGKRWKLVCSAERVEGGVQAVVAPQLVGPDSPLYRVDGTTSIVQFETDVLGLFSIIEEDPGPETTAYGCLADFINAVSS